MQKLNVSGTVYNYSYSSSNHAVAIPNLHVNVKARSNERNMLHATSSNIVACNMLRCLNTLLRDVARCWMMLHEFDLVHTSCNIVLDDVECNMLHSFEQALSCKFMTHKSHEQL